MDIDNTSSDNASKEAGGSFHPGDGFRARALRHLGLTTEEPESASVAGTPSAIRAEEAQELKQWEESQLKAAADADVARVRRHFTNRLLIRLPEPCLSRRPSKRTGRLQGRATSPLCASPLRL